MNWRRGFMRLWMLVTALWVVFVAVGSGCVVWRFGRFEHAGLLTEDELFGWQSWPIWDVCNVTPMTPWQYTALALAPPLIMLAIGLGVTWIAKGFRDQ